MKTNQWDIHDIIDQCTIVDAKTIAQRCLELYEHVVLLPANVNNVIDRSPYSLDIDVNVQWLDDEIVNKGNYHYAYVSDSPAKIYMICEALRQCPVYYGKKRNVVLSAVQLDGILLEYADETLRDDEQIVQSAIQNNGNALIFASQRLVQQNDFKLLYEALSHSGGHAFQRASPAVRNSKRDVLAAMKLCSGFEPYLYCSDDLKCDKEVIMGAIEYGSKRNRSTNSSDVWITLNRQADALQYGYNLFNDERKFVLFALANNPYFLKYTSPRLQDDITVVRTAILKSNFIREGYSMFKYASARLRNDPQFVIELLQYDRSIWLHCLPYVSDALLGNREVIEKCVQSNGMSLKFASNTLKDDELLVRSAVRVSGEKVLAHASDRVRELIRSSQNK
jgi:hypothetical protein